MNPLLLRYNILVVEVLYNLPIQFVKNLRLKVSFLYDFGKSSGDYYIVTL